MKTYTTTLFSTTTLALCGMLLLSPNSKAEVKTPTLSATEEIFIQNAAAFGLSDLKIAELAVKKADNADIKAFAKKAVTDHTKVNKELNTLAANQGVKISTVLTPAHAEALQKLENVKGAEFDKEFLAEVLHSHHIHMTSYEKESKDHNDKELKAFVDKTIPTMQAHYDKAKLLAAK